jgi:hypothetical protein
MDRIDEILSLYEGDVVEMKDGGRIGYKDKGFVKGSGPKTGSALDADVNTKKVKKALNSIKKQRNKKQLFEWSENSDWYRKLQKDLGGMKDKGLNREYTNKLINKTIDEFFPNAYHGKNAMKNFRNDMVVNSFVNHLKQVGEFDGQEKFAKSLEQFTKGKDADHLYEGINKSWKSWIAGEFEVDGINRAQLKKELKARGVDYNKINNWSASASQKRGVSKIKELKWLDNQNKKFSNRTADQVRNLFIKKFPNTNFDHRVNELTMLKNTGKYISGDGISKPILGIKTGERAKWLKDSFGLQFQGNYSKMINAADQLEAAGKMDEAARLRKGADNFFGPDGIITKAAGEGEHALARSFDMLNPDHQLRINSLVSGDLNQFKKWNFDIPVKRYFDEYNKPETTSARKKELGKLIEERRSILNGLTGGDKKGMVAKGVVDFKYGNKITATSNVVPLDKLENLNVEELVMKGKGYEDEFLKVADKVGVSYEQKLTDKNVRQVIQRMGCPGLAGGGRTGFQDGTTCFNKGIEKLKGDPTKYSPGDQANLKRLAKAAAKGGRTALFLKNVLGPAAIAGELIFEGGAAANKFMEGMPIKQALGESYINKYILGPKTQIDLEAERAKEMERGEEFAMAERGRRKAPFMARSATADAQRLRKREQEMEQAFPTITPERIDELLATQDLTVEDTGLDYEQIQDIIKRDDQTQAIADAGGVANMAGGGIAAIRRPNAIPPESGPQPQGLENLKYYVTNT